jgi:peptide/nickel transport system ATP-binding protein
MSTAGGDQQASPLLSVRDLSVVFATADGTLIRAASNVGFDVMPGETLGVVGESGSGKSVTLRSLVGLHLPGRIVKGTALLDGLNILGLADEDLDDVRGTKIGMVYQDAGSALNPVVTVGGQLVEVLRVKTRMGRQEAQDTAVSLLSRVGVPSPAERMRDYSHQLSGGLRQRVMIALALAPKPVLLLADEPTTALDVTVQDQVLSLLADLRRDESMAMVLVSHDLGVIAQECDTVAVMYAGYVVEYGGVDEVLESPRHPYTAALMASTLPLERSAVRRPLRPIRGQPPELGSLPSGCPFQDRCQYVHEGCSEAGMELDRAVPAHGTACISPEVLES